MEETRAIRKKIAEKIKSSRTIAITSHLRPDGASIGSGIAIVPRYAKYLLPQNAFLVPIISRNSHFGEYMYLNSSRKNDAAVLFHDKLISSLFPE